MSKQEPDKQFCPGQLFLEAFLQRVSEINILSAHIHLWFDGYFSRSNRFTTLSLMDSIVHDRSTRQDGDNQ
jgi:hypothetical protein